MSSVKELKKFKIALAGNANVGKSVIFNELTGGKALVANWPGVTVEKKIGKIRLDEVEIELIDLPGIYSLTPYTVDEIIARKFIVEEKPDAIINIVSAINLDRNLYLTILLLEMGAKLVIALNMMDLAEENGIKINVEALSKELQTPIIPTIAIKRKGLDKLLQETVKIAKLKKTPKFRINYGKPVEAALEELARIISSDPALRNYESRWLAIKLLEEDEHILSILNNLGKSSLLKRAEKLREKLEKQLGASVEDYMIQKRYEFISNLILKYVARAPRHITFTDLIDSVLTSRLYGILILVSVIYMMFEFAFNVATPFMDMIDWLFSSLLYDLIYASSLPVVIKSLLADGIVSGVGTILTFVPNIALLFLAIAVLEDIGYLSRAAYVVDKLMNFLKLTGKSIIPMAIGFGCNVPAVMATRTIEDETDRKVTAMIVPLMSCMARLPVYLVVGGAIFAAYLGSIVLSMYVMGVLLAFLMAAVFRKLFFKTPSSGFIMELPPYLLPIPKNVLAKTWDRTEKFLIRAGTVILIGVILVWVLSVTGPSGWIGVDALHDASLLEQSWIGVLGHILEPLFSPLGWDWRAIAALVFGFVAKEIVVATMGVLYSAGEENLPQVLARFFTPVQAYAYMAFVLIYVPCLITLSAIKSELGTKYALITLAYELILAYLVSLIITVIGSTMWGV